MRCWEIAGNENSAGKEKYTHTQTHKHKHTHIHKHTHTQKHIHKQTHKQTNKQTNTHIYLMPIFTLNTRAKILNSENFKMYITLTLHFS